MTHRIRRKRRFLPFLGSSFHLSELRATTSQILCHVGADLSRQTCRLSHQCTGLGSEWQHFHNICPDLHQNSVRVTSCGSILRKCARSPSLTGSVMAVASSTAISNPVAPISSDGETQP